MLEFLLAVVHFISVGDEFLIGLVSPRLRELECYLSSIVLGTESNRAATLSSDHSLLRESRILRSTWVSFR